MGNSSQTVKARKGVSISVKSRKVTVKGPRGTLTRHFRHLPADMMMQNGNTLKVEKWFGNRSELAAVNTVCSHVENMQKGVTQGFLYKMRAVYAHFPINVVITGNNTVVEVRNFLGEKFTRHVDMLPGVTCKASPNKEIPPRGKRHRACLPLSGPDPAVHHGQEEGYPQIPRRNLRIGENYHHW